MKNLFDQLASLRREGRPFALATVVGRQAPVSAHLGDHAVIFPDGRMEGFVGGACAREIVRRQALAALETRQGRLVSIRPGGGDASQSTGEHVVVPMTCASEGAVDVYVEPYFEPRALVVVGATPVADALARLGRSMDYAVVRVVDARERDDVAAGAGDGVTVAALDELASELGRFGGDAAIVVASQGHYDEEALEQILKEGRAGYVGLVASRKRGEAIRALLAEGGTPNVDRVRSPAGIDLGARTAAEVAVSILAEIVQVLPRVASSPTATPSHPGQPGASPEAAAARPEVAVDPVCGMEVVVGTARHTADVDGMMYYFCCPHCRAAFVKDPQAFLAHQTTT
jgi:xanthine dehydrogenase accessory factor